jgi:diguanylate cyclase (GGDEF)-like protein
VSRRPSRRLRGTSGAAIAGGVRGRTDLQARVEVAEAVAELSHWALRADQPDELLREALRVAVDVIGADYGTAVRRLSDGRMRVAHETGPDPFPTGTVLTLAPERSYVLHVVESGEPFVSADLRRDPRVTPPVPLLERGVVSGLAVPVRGGHSVLGVLALHSRHRRRFGRQDVAAATALASVVATAWEQVAQRARLGHQALHDPLTGLGNRVLFLDRLEHALTRRPAGPGEQAAGVAVMLLDLDDFKAVNDSFGHAAGDRLLTVAAHRFDAIIRPEDTIARLGGDEFGVLCEDVADAATAAALAARLQAACAAPVVVGGASLSFSASIGVTWTRRAAARPGGGSVLLAEADAALYRAKDQGRGQAQVFDERLSRATRRRRQLEGELQAALDAGEFRVHYQPVGGPTTCTRWASKRCCGGSTRPAACSGRTSSSDGRADRTAPADRPVGAVRRLRADGEMAGGPAAHRSSALAGRERLPASAGRSWAARRGRRRAEEQRLGRGGRWRSS